VDALGTVTLDRGSQPVASKLVDDREHERGDDRGHHDDRDEPHDPHVDQRVVPMRIGPHDTSIGRLVRGSTLGAVLVGDGGKAATRRCAIVHPRVGLPASDLAWVRTTANAAPCSAKLAPGYFGPMHTYQLRRSPEDLEGFVSDRALQRGDVVSIDDEDWRVVSIEPGEGAYEAMVDIEPLERAPT
jgi:hypothetical protein